MRWLHVLTAAVLFGAAFTAACGGTPSKPHMNTDGGMHTTTGGSGSSGSTGSMGCAVDADCPGAFCIQGKCGHCNDLVHPLACPTGETCRHSDGDCVAPGTSSGSAGSTGASGSTGSSGTSGTTGAMVCSHRTDCPGAEACINDLCSTAAADAGCSSNDACDKAYICQASHCVLGCYSNNDCHGTSTPACIPGNPGHCGACSSNTQCLSGENCEQGQCVAETACTDASTCGGIGCVGGYCAPCTADGDCLSGQSCNTTTGKCGGCSDDAQCAAAHSSPAWWCQAVDGGGTCKLGCVDDSLCSPPQLGCCNLAAGQTCDTSTHACANGQTTQGTTAGNTSSTTGTTAATTAGTSAGTTGTSSTSAGTTTGSTTGTTGCGSFDCNSCFQLGESCDMTNCQCVGGTTTGTSAGNGGTSGGGNCTVTGDSYQPCNPDCSCNDPSLVCTDAPYGGDPYDPSNQGDQYLCAFYIGICLGGGGNPPIYCCNPSDGNCPP